MFGRHLKCYVWSPLIATHHKELTWQKCLHRPRVHRDLPSVGSWQFDLLRWRRTQLGLSCPYPGFGCWVSCSIFSLSISNQKTINRPSYAMLFVFVVPDFGRNNDQTGSTGRGWFIICQWLLADVDLCRVEWIQNYVFRFTSQPFHPRICLLLWSIKTLMNRPPNTFSVDAISLMVLEHFLMIFNPDFCTCMITGLAWMTTWLT